MNPIALKTQVKINTVTVSFCQLWLCVKTTFYVRRKLVKKVKQVFA